MALSVQPLLVSFSPHALEPIQKATAVAFSMRYDRRSMHSDTCSPVDGLSLEVSEVLMEEGSHWWRALRTDCQPHFLPAFLCSTMEAGWPAKSALLLQCLPLCDEPHPWPLRGHVPCVAAGVCAQQWDRGPTICFSLPILTWYSHGRVWEILKSGCQVLADSLHIYCDRS